MEFWSATTEAHTTVTLEMMSNSLVAHKRQMMTALETLMLRFKGRNDSEGIGLLDVILNLWTKTLIAEHAASKAYKANVVAMQQQLSPLVSETRKQLGCTAADPATTLSRDHIKLGAQVAPRPNADADDVVPDSKVSTIRPLIEFGSETWEAVEQQVRASDIRIHACDSTDARQH